MRIIIDILKHNWIKYGFETIVVTVGILGAFTLESWRDNRQEEKELFEVYRTIADDLYTDSVTLDRILANFESRIILMKRILTEPVSKDAWIENDSLWNSFTGYPDFQESLRGLDLLKSKITAGGEAGILAGRISNFYNVRLLENSVSRNEVDDILYNNVKYWMENEVWLSASLIEEDRAGLSKYVQDNPYFRNRVAVYVLMFNNHYHDLKTYKEEGTKLAMEINTFLESRSKRLP